jgi:hypothetical protein
MPFSLWGDKPVAYFDFVRGAVHWRYTNADRAREYDGHTWLPAPIKRSAIKVGSERRKLSITVTLPSALDVIANWRPFPPRDRIALTILVQDRGTDVVEVDWIGRVLGPKFNGATTELTCEPSLTTARRAGLSLCWQKGCPLAVYSQGLGMCNVAKADFAVPATLTQVTAITFMSDAFLAIPSGRLAGGFLEYARVSDGVIEQRSIMAHSADTITIDYALADIDPGLEVTAYPGCKGTEDDCNDFFDNGENFGGESLMPRKSPNDGQPVR